MIKIKETACKSAISKCGFPSGGWAINPYIGCQHGCKYCYARFIKRFTGHKEEWGNFVDIKVNLAEVLAKQLKSAKYKAGTIHIGTVTDPYQPLEKKFGLTRKILKVLNLHEVSVEILTKSDLVLRDLDLIKQIKNIDVCFTINTLDEKWQKLTEPLASPIENRFRAIKKLVENKIPCLVLMGPYWPIFTNPEKLFKKFKELGVTQVFTESFNTSGANWTDVEKVLIKNYPQFLGKIKETFFNHDKFFSFYSQEKQKIETLGKKYNLPVTIYFGLGHAGKFNR